ncbi:MAG TPA: PAS domain S-box protein, partial [Bryobacteraceae bacterium]|nr:PAS domain S-box protein [Bryobacteraceae bacterium]
MEPSASTIALPECERFFRAAFAHAAIGMAIVDARGVFTYANQALCRMGGYEEQELYRLNFSATLHPDDRAGRAEMFQQLLAGQVESYVHERRLLAKDGSIRWVRVSVTAPGERTGPAQVIALVEDITERKQAEDALRASEERFRIAAENASDMIYEWDLATGEVGTFGPSPQLLGDWPLPRTFDAWTTLVHPDDLERLLAASTVNIENGLRFSDEYRVIGRTGKIYHYSNRGQAVLNGAGKTYKCVGLIADITERKLAEEAISQLAAIVQCSADAIIAVDQRGAITTWNDGARALLGYTAAQALCLPFTALLASEDLARELLSQSGKGQFSRLDEALFRRHDGRQVPVLLSVSPIRKSDGQLSGSAIVARDISARKQAEKEMAHRALHDHLTGLPNRLSLANGLAQSIANANLDVSGTAVIFVDLDGFKFVNDTLGHEAGDLLLQQISQRLSACVRHGDMLARMGGDEFMVVVNG